MTCRLGLRFRISDFKPETGFGVRAPLVDLDHEAQLPLPGEGVGLGLWKSPKTKGQVSSRIPLQNDFFRVAFTGQNL